MSSLESKACCSNCVGFDLQYVDFSGEEWGPCTRRRPNRVKGSDRCDRYAAAFCGAEQRPLHRSGPGGRKVA